jgi:hypothetical protein
MPFFSGMAKPTWLTRNGDTQPFLGVDTPHLQPTSGWLLSHHRLKFQRS